MRTDRPQPLDLLPPAGDRVGGEPAADAPDRRAVPQDPVLWQSADDGGPRATRGGGQPQAGPAADGVDGPGGARPQAADRRRLDGRSGLSLLAPRPGPGPGQRGLEFGHHLCSDEKGVHVPDGGDRLVQPVRAVVAAVEYHGRRVLPGGARGGALAGPTGDLQHRPGFAVHVARVHRPAGGGGCRGEPGRSGAGAGQRVRGTPLEEREIRGYLHQRLREHTGIGIGPEFKFRRF
jgi:hypothetical protein